MDKVPPLVIDPVIRSASVRASRSLNVSKLFSSFSSSKSYLSQFKLKAWPRLTFHKEVSYIWAIYAILFVEECKEEVDENLNILFEFILKKEVPKKFFDF